MTCSHAVTPAWSGRDPHARNLNGSTDQYEYIGHEPPRPRQLRLLLDKREYNCVHAYTTSTCACLYLSERLTKYIHFHRDSQQQHCHHHQRELTALHAFASLARRYPSHRAVLSTRRRRRTRMPASISRRATSSTHIRRASGPPLRTRASHQCLHTGHPTARGRHCRDSAAVYNRDTAAHRARRCLAISSRLATSALVECAARVEPCGTFSPGYAAEG